MKHKLKRTINLPTAIFIIIGYVVGATIFILPGELSAIAGPGVFLAYLLAGIPALFYCFIIAQVGSALPTSGGGYILIKDALSPFLGFIYLWVVLSLAVVAVPLIAMGFARYLSLVLTGLDVQWIAFASIAVFVLTNCLGMAVAGTVQNIMVVLFLLSLLLFSGSGIIYGDSALLEPLLPFGYQGVLLAAATAYFSYAGILVVAEIAGEIKNPGRNIPLAIAISFIVVILTYTLVPWSLSQMMPWQDLGKDQTPVVTAAQQYLSPFFVNIIWIGALLAAATSINGIMMGLSRDLYKGAVEGLFPRVLAKIHPLRGTPVAAILVIGTLSILGVMSGNNIVEYAQVAVVGLMITQILTSIAVLRLPRVLPEVYAQSRFKLKPIFLVFFALASALISLIFLAVLVVQTPVMGGVSVIYLGIGSIYYLRSQRRQGSV